MKEEDKTRLREAAEKAQAKPCWRCPLIINGFRFDIYWQKAMWSPKDMTFEVVMFYSPGWLHSHHYYPADIESLIETVDKAIEKERDLYPNGGQFPADYLKDWR